MNVVRYSVLLSLSGSCVNPFLSVFSWVATCPSAMSWMGSVPSALCMCSTNLWEITLSSSLPTPPHSSPTFGSLCPSSPAHWYSSVSSPHAVSIFRGEDRNGPQLCLPRVTVSSKMRIGAIGTCFILEKELSVILLSNRLMWHSTACGAATNIRQTSDELKSTLLFQANLWYSSSPSGVESHTRVRFTWYQISLYRSFWFNHVATYSAV